ncbi:MAG: carboxypeptidase-like regulatory domain-containing protein [Planctomycetaceae bacterium]|nr:carboxypeptidase-like regulatory domain-containing protein [Planctomycetaceae bacterium]
MLRSFFPLSFAVLFLSAVAGCPGGVQTPEGMPKLQPTVIKITQGGTPLAGAEVALIPAKSTPWQAGATTDETGTAKIMTKTKYPGAAPGKYAIVIMKRESEKSKLAPVDPVADPKGYTKYMEESRKEKLASYDLIDPKYSKSLSSPESIEIVDGPNEKTIDVGAAVRVKRG